MVGGQFAQVGQDQQRGADHRQVYAQVKQHGTGQLEAAHPGQMEVIEPGGKERPLEQPAAKAGQGSDQHPAGDQPLVIDLQAFLDPVDPVGDILLNQCHGGDQTGNEAAAGQVVAAQENVHRNQQRQWQQTFGYHPQHHRMTVIGPAATAFVTGRHVQAHAHDQLVDTQGRDPQHRDFAEGVEASEVDQNHVDHIGAAATGFAVGQEKVGDAVQRSGHQRVVDGTDQPADHGGDTQITYYTARR